MTRAPEERRKKEHGRVSLWSRRFRWQERAAAWDAVIDQRIRERRLDLIEKMAVRHASQSELGLEDLMRPIIAFDKAMQDPARAAAFEGLDVAFSLAFRMEYVSLFNPQILNGGARTR